MKAQKVSNNVQQKARACFCLVPQSKLWVRLTTTSGQEATFLDGRALSLEVVEQKWKDPGIRQSYRITVSGKSHMRRFKSHSLSTKIWWSTKGRQQRLSREAWIAAIPPVAKPHPRDTRLRRPPLSPNTPGYVQRAPPVVGHNS